MYSKNKNPRGIKSDAVHLDSADDLYVENMDKVLKETTTISYICSECGIEGVKLWRQYQTFLNHIKLLCADCAWENQKENIDSHETKPDESGMREGKYQRTVKIGNLIPAILTEENDTFWGYTSVPMDRFYWWQNLPTYKEK